VWHGSGFNTATHCLGDKVDHIIVIRHICGVPNLALLVEKQDQIIIETNLVFGFDITKCHLEVALKEMVNALE